MWKPTLFCLAACFSAGMLHAQSAFPVPDGMVGVAYSYDFGQIIDPYLSEIPANIGFSFSFTATGGTLPPGLTMASNTVSGTPTQPGTYNFTVTFNESFVIEGMPFSFSAPFPESITVTGTAGPPVAVNPGALTFSLTEGSTSAVTQSIALTNNGSVSQSYTASASAGSGGSWLSISPAAGNIAAVSSGSINVSVNPSGLAAGTYLGTVSVSVSPANQQFAVAVTATVSGGQAQLQLSQSGFRYQTIAGGGNPSSQSLTVLNGGSGSLNFSASASTTSGGPWLSVSPASGAVSATASGSVTISVQSAGLAAGDYYGQVQISADGA